MSGSDASTSPVQREGTNVRVMFRCRSVFFLMMLTGVCLYAYLGSAVGVFRPREKGVLPSTPPWSNKPGTHTVLGKPVLIAKPAAAASAVKKRPTASRTATQTAGALRKSSAVSRAVSKSATSNRTAQAVVIRTKPPAKASVKPSVSVRASVSASQRASCPLRLSDRSTQQMLRKRVRVAAKGSPSLYPQPPAIIWFIRTSQETSLALIDECAISSAVDANPSALVVLLSNSISCSSLGRLARKASFVLMRFEYERIMAHHPMLLDWYKSGKWKGQFDMNNLGNAARLALLADFGGVYMDTDMLSLRPLFRDGAGYISNAVGMEDEYFINNAVLAFGPSHPFLYAAIDTFVDTFRKTWGWNGPRLITRVYRGIGVDGAKVDPAVTQASSHGGVTVRPVSEFYPIDYDDADMLFLPLSNVLASERLSEMLEHSRLVHLWNKGTKKQMEQVHGVRPSALSKASPSPVHPAEEGSETGEDGVDDVDVQDGQAGVEGGNALEGAAPHEHGHGDAPSAFNVSSLVSNPAMPMVEWLMAAACPDVFVSSFGPVHPLHLSALGAHTSAIPVPTSWEQTVQAFATLSSPDAAPVVFKAWRVLRIDAVNGPRSCGGLNGSVTTSDAPSGRVEQLVAPLAHACVTPWRPAALAAAALRLPMWTSADSYLQPVAGDSTLLLQCGGIVSPMPRFHGDLLLRAFGVSPSSAAQRAGLSSWRGRQPGRSIIVGSTVSMWIRVLRAPRGATETGTCADAMKCSNTNGACLTETGSAKVPWADALLLRITEEEQLVVSSPLRRGARTTLTSTASITGGGWHHIALVHQLDFSTSGPVTKMPDGKLTWPPSTRRRVRQPTASWRQTVQLYLDGVPVARGTMRRSSTASISDVHSDASFLAPRAFAMSCAAEDKAKSLSGWMRQTTHVYVDAFIVLDEPLTASGVLHLRNQQILHRGNT